MSRLRDADTLLSARSAENWLLDAATFAHDGAIADAITAATNAIRSRSA